VASDAGDQQPVSASTRNMVAGMKSGLRRLRASLGSVLAVFGNRDLARLVIGWAGMSFATWAYAIALGVYAFEQGGTTAVGIAAAVRLLPGALASPFAGLLGDRYPRRLVLVSSALLSGLAIALSAGAVAEGAPAWMVYALAGLFTVASTPYVPAEGALLPLVSRTPQELSAANVTRSQMDNQGFLAGSLAAGALLALASPAAAFAAAAVAGVLTAAVLATLSRDERPYYEIDEHASGVLHQTALGLRALLADPKLRLVGIVLSGLFFIEGVADVMIVVIALDLLEIGEGSVGWLNAAWGVGALLAGAGLAMLLDRDNLVAGLAVGCLITGTALALPGAWPATPAAYLSFLLIGFGYTFVEVVARTLLQRLGSDETLARVIGILETSRLAATALGAIVAPAAVALLGVRGALLVLGALLPFVALLRWRALRNFEIGAPVSERHYSLLRGSSIFAPLPIDTIEGVSRNLVELEVEAGEEMITQGDHGDRFYLIDVGEVEVIEDGIFKRHQTGGECFGEIALLRDVPRTATVRATRETRLLALDREHFIETVTGHMRSLQSAEAVAADWLAGGIQQSRD
jgi:MFS family permease